MKFKRLKKNLRKTRVTSHPFNFKKRKNRKRKMNNFTKGIYTNSITVCGGIIRVITRGFIHLVVFKLITASTLPVS